MAKKTKKKAVAKMTEVVKPYATMTEEQFDEIKSIVSWDNPLSQLSEIKDGGDMSMLEIGFKLGEIHCLFNKAFENIEKVLTQIGPEEDEIPTFDWDDDDEEEEEEDDEQST